MCLMGKDLLFLFVCFFALSLVRTHVFEQCCDNHLDRLTFLCVKLQLLFLSFYLSSLTMTIMCFECTQHTCMFCFGTKNKIFLLHTSILIFPTRLGLNQPF